MSRYYCKTHGVTVAIETSPFSTIRRLNYTGHVIPGNCALPKMNPPREMKPGDTYHNPATGRVSRSSCEIVEVKR